MVTDKQSQTTQLELPCNDSRVRAHETGESPTAGQTKYKVKPSETAFLKNKGRISETAVF